MGIESKKTTLNLEEFTYAQLQLLSILQGIEKRLGLIEENIKEILEYQNLIVLRPKDVANIFRVDVKTVNKWINDEPHLSVVMNGKKYVTIANIKLLFELHKEKYKWLEKDLPAYLKKIESPTLSLLREFIFKE